MKWERTFEFSAPVDKVWQAFTDRECEFRAWDPENAYLSGGAIKVEFTERTEHGSLAWSETAGSDRWEMSVTFTETERGCSITIVRSGFGEGDDWLMAAIGRFLGWEHALRDIEVYFRTGRPIGRFHRTAWGTMGMTVVADGGGVRVVDVADGSLGEQAGVRPGDIVLRVWDAPVYGLEEYWLMENVLRDHADEVEIEYVRGADVRSGSGRLVKAAV